MTIIKCCGELLINPFLGLLLILGMSIFFVWNNKYSYLTRSALCTVLIGFLLLSTGWFPRYITNTLEYQYPVINQTNPKIKWVVVLGGGQNDKTDMPVNDVLSSASIKRLIEGVRLFRTLPDATLILSGGNSAGEESEALHLAQFSHWFSIPKNKILLEDKSLTTAEQAHNLVTMIHQEPFYLVTSALHMPRAMALCQQQGLNPIAAPTDFNLFWNTGSEAKIIIPNTYNLAYFTIAMHELLGRVWAKFFISKS
jgi:uncharacterized SAM-binding protein YcdF (DUF218 family)